MAASCSRCSTSRSATAPRSARTRRPALTTASLIADFAGAPSRRLGRGACGHAEGRRPPRLRQRLPMVNGERIVRAAPCSRRAAPLSIRNLLITSMRPSLARSAVRRADQPARHRPEARQSCSPGCSPRSAARVDLLFHLPTGTIDRRARPKLRDVEPDTIVTVAVTSTSTARRRRNVRARRIRSTPRRDRRITLTFFKARKDISKSCCLRGRAALRLRHRADCMTACCR